MTAAVMHILIAYVGLWPYAAKIAGVGASFFTVYLLRSFIVFKARPDKVGESAAVGRTERDLVQSTS